MMHHQTFGGENSAFSVGEKVGCDQKNNEDNQKQQIINPG
jgi:hypothetical protein